MKERMEEIEKKSEEHKRAEKEKDALAKRMEEMEKTLDANGERAIVDEVAKTPEKTNDVAGDIVIEEPEEYVSSGESMLFD